MDFVQTMIEINRMHSYYDDYCRGCPLDGKGYCNEPDFELSREDLEEAEALVWEWSRNHPVVYPTWEEFFKTANLEDARLTDHVRADIAEKLGLKPVVNKK